MKSIDELVDAIAPLRRSDLDTWIGEAFVVAHREDDTLRFSDMECARIRLICTLTYELEVDPETLPLILSLMDQLYEARGKLKALASAVTAQPQEVRDAVMLAIWRSQEHSGVEESTEG